MNKSQIFTTAWNTARNAAARFGGSVKSYFAESLKMAYANTGKCEISIHHAGGAYRTVFITNASQHANVFGNWRASVSSDGSLELMQVRASEIKQIEAIVSAINTPAKTHQPKSGRYIELSAVAERRGLNHGRAWCCSDYDIECRGVNPMFENESIGDVYAN